MPDRRIFLSLILVACGSEPSGSETTSVLCSDGVDNDADGEVDCADLDCAPFCGSGDGGPGRDSSTDSSTEFDASSVPDGFTPDRSTELDAVSDAPILMDVPSGGRRVALTDDDIRAFPGALGFGEDAEGARATNSVYFVTNLNNSGAGSLDQAVLDAEPNGGYIIFRTGGTIVLTAGNDQYVRSNTYLAGQTAPGDGVTVYGTRTWWRGSDSVMRHLRFRVGSDAGVDLGDDALTVGSVSLDYAITDNVIDHCSFTWGQDENVAFSTKASGRGTNPSASINRFSFTNNIVAHEFNNKYNFILYGENIDNISLIGNLFAGSSARNIRSSTSDATYEMVNNAIYNYGSGHVGTVNTTFDIIGNVYDDGPASQSLQTIRIAPCSPANCPPSGDTNNSTTRVYYADNTFNGGSATYDDDMEDALQASRQVASGYTPLASASVPSLVEGAGARNGLGDGLDAVDLDIMDDWINDTASLPLPNREANTTALPMLAAGTAYADTDNDGLSDAYELDQGGTTTSTDGFARPATAVIGDGTTIDQSGVSNYATDGYTHLDIFLASLANDWDSFPRSE